MEPKPFKIGQKVVCVKADGLSMLPVYKPLEKNRIYTVRAIQWYPDPRLRVWGVLLEEIVNRSDVVFKWELAYFHGRFRPLEPRATDISLFKALLVPSLDTYLEEALRETLDV